MHQTDSPPAPPAFREALIFWLRLGFISFGGPAGQIAIMHEFLVDKKRWISDSKFLHALNYCMLLPGPEAQQLATYVGWLLHGVRGGLAAGILFVLPSAIILWGLSVSYVTFGQVPVVQAIFEFLKPAAVAIVAGAIVKIGKKSLQTPLHYGVAVSAFVAIYALNVPFLAIVMCAIIIGMVKYFYNKRVTSNSRNTIERRQVPTQKDESTYLINIYTATHGNRFSTRQLFRQIATATLLWGLPLTVFYLMFDDFGFWKQLCLFFTQAAFVTFGGAYAILPYVAQISVEKFFWLSNLQMLDGLALGETTPGPLIIVLAFVGFMAAYNNFGSSVTMASLGLIATVFYTFLPCFLFIFAGAPLLEKSQASSSAKSVLQFVTAAITGAILNLCLSLGQSVIMPYPPVILWLPLIWTAISIIALQIFRVNIILWIGLTITMGLLKYLALTG